MIQRQEGGEDLGMFIGAWTSLLREARERALADSPGLEGDALRAASERHGVRLSLENLNTFPFVREALAAGKLSLQGWYLNIFDGALEIWDPEQETFTQVS